jgi:tyrosyl-tRNA synthetase
VSVAATVLFGEGSLEMLNVETKTLLLENSPTYVPKSNADLIEVLIESGLSTSKRESRTFIESGAVTLNSEKISDVNFKLNKEHFKNGLALLRRGKKNLCVLVLS